MYFTDQIGRIPVNRRFRNDFEQAYDYALETFPKGQVRLPGDYEVLIVPTYLYKRLFSVGADMAVPRSALKAAGLQWLVN